jgi:hypothetical protein
VGHVVHEQSPKETTVEERIPTVSLGDLGVPGRVDVEQPSSVPETFPDGLSEGWA